jgi:cytochrome P450
MAVSNITSARFLKIGTYAYLLPIAGYETTSVALVTFMLAMLVHPNIQKRVQQELDSVIAPNRFPEFSDEPHLPYLSAVLKEVFRYAFIMLF